MDILRKIKLKTLKAATFLPQETYVPAYYEYYTGKKLNLKSPKELGEKIQWLKVFYHRPILNKLVDKYAVRDYVEEKAGAHVLNDLIEKYNHPQEVNLEELPNQFVIKGTHGYHLNLIVKDKNKINRLKFKYLLHKWHRRNHYYRCGMEWAYKNVEPRIIVEKYLEEPNKKVINDYKFFCFNGEPKFIQVDIDRGKMDYRCFYDLSWKKLPFYTNSREPFPNSVERPENLKEMIDTAKLLSEDFLFVRVDLYSINGKTIFGEMTFYPASGKIKFIPKNYNLKIGNYLDLPNLN